MSSSALAIPATGEQFPARKIGETLALSPGTLGTALGTLQPAASPHLQHTLHPNGRCWYTAIPCNKPKAQTCHPPHGHSSGRRHVSSPRHLTRSPGFTPRGVPEEIWLLQVALPGAATIETYLRSCKIYMDGILWQVSAFGSTRIKATPAALTSGKNSTLNQSEEPCRKDKTTNSTNWVLNVTDVPNLLARKACRGALLPLDKLLNSHNLELLSRN